MLISMRVLLSVALCAILAAGILDSSGRVTLYDRKVFPPTWHLAARASRYQRMHFSILTSIAVKQQNLKKLEELAVYVQRKIVEGAIERRNEIRDILDAPRGPAAGENEDANAMLRVVDEEDEESDIENSDEKENTVVAK